MEYDVIIKALETIKLKFPDYIIRDIVGRPISDEYNRETGLKVPYEIEEEILIELIKKDDHDLTDNMVDVTVDKNTGEIIEIVDFGTD